jgi:peptidoglycan hydrolase CwlO-like protein
MIRYILIAWVLTAIVAIFYYGIANTRAERIKALEGEKNSLKTEIKQISKNLEACNVKIDEFNRAQEKAAEKIEKVRTIIRTVKSDCNCYDVALPDDVRKLFKYE